MFSQIFDAFLLILSVYDDTASVVQIFISCVNVNIPFYDLPDHLR